MAADSNTADHPRIIDARIPASQRTAGAVPTPSLAAPFGLRLADPGSADVTRITAWMSAPHVAPYWQQAWPEERWHDHLRRMFEDTYERPYIVSIDGREFGYVELYRAARDVVADHYEAEPHDIGLHGAIGDLDYVGKNVAFRFWLAIVPAIFEADPQCRRVVTDPAADHPVAVRLDALASAKLGGRELGRVELPHKAAVLFEFPRPDAREGVPAAP